MGKIVDRADKFVGRMFGNQDMPPSQDSKTKDTDAKKLLAEFVKEIKGQRPKE